MFLAFLGSGNSIVRLLLRIKCLTIKQIKTNRELRNVAIFASVLIHIISALPVGRLAREMTPVSPLKPLVKFARLSQMSNYRNFKQEAVSEKAKSGN